jgi:hypothetical protein
MAANCRTLYWASFLFFLYLGVQWYHRWWERGAGGIMAGAGGMVGYDELEFRACAAVISEHNAL